MFSASYKTERFGTIAYRHLFYDWSGYKAVLYNWYSFKRLDNTPIFFASVAATFAYDRLSVKLII